MAVINWGECDVFHGVPKDGTAPTASDEWQELPTPKEDTTKLTANAGTEKTATEEGGGIVDYMPGKNSYTLEFDLFLKKGETLPDWLDPEKINDGVVPGEHSFRVEGQDKGDGNSDKGTWCILIERSVVRVEDSYSTADGSLLHVVATALKPAKGNTVKYYDDPKTKYQASEAA